MSCLLTEAALFMSACESFRRVKNPEKSPTISDKNTVFSGQRDGIPEIVPTVSDFYPEFTGA